MGRVTLDVPFDIEGENFTFHIDLDENETLENAVKMGIVLGSQATHWHFRPNDPAFKVATGVTLRMSHEI